MASYINKTQHTAGIYNYTGKTFSEFPKANTK